MTKDKDLKRLAHERAEKTGESYSTARQQLEAKRGGASDGPPIASARPWAVRGLPLASDEARIAGHPWVEPEHLLLGLLSHGEVLPTLHAMRVSPVALRHHTERSLPPKRDTRVNPTLSAGVAWALSLGLQEARRRGADAASSHDLLLALALLDRPVSAVLKEFGAGDRQLRAHLGYDELPIESRVRIAIVNRLLPLLGQSTTNITTLVGDVQLDTTGDRQVITVASGQALALARFADDIKLAAESLLDSQTVTVNIAATA